MGERKRNRLGSASLAVAIAGFLVVELQPWLPLAVAKTAMVVKQAAEPRGGESFGEARQGVRPLAAETGGHDDAGRPCQPVRPVMPRG